MHKLCHPLLVVPVIFAFVLSACGRDTYYPEPKMTEEQAFSEINTALSSGRGAFGKPVSTNGLRALIEKLIAEGKIKVPGQTRGAIDTSQVNLDALTQMLNLIGSGKANNIFSLATQVLALIPTITQITQSGGTSLDIILSILQQAAPLIATIAPQFAPIISGLLVIVPMVVSFIKLFSKPKPSPSPTASLMFFELVRA